MTLQSTTVDDWKKALGPVGKRQRRRKKDPAKVEGARGVRSKNSPTSTEMTRVAAEIESVALVPPPVLSSDGFRVRVQLHNGSHFTMDPTQLHQRTDEAVWLALRKTLNVTASEFSAVLNSSFFTSRQKLLNIKLGRATPAPAHAQACAWGLRMEPKAFRTYCEATGHAVQETGLHVAAISTTNNNNTMYLGASPDGLVSDRNDGTLGLLEIKSLWGRRNRQRDLPVFTNCPNRFYAQIQGQLAICNREWCDLILYVPPRSNKQRRHYSILRVPRNREYWDTVLQPSLEEFVRDVEAMSYLSTTASLC